MNPSRKEPTTVVVDGLPELKVDGKTIKELLSEIDLIYKWYEQQKPSVAKDAQTVVATIGKHTASVNLAKLRNQIELQIKDVIYPRLQIQMPLTPYVGKKSKAQKKAEKKLRTQVKIDGHEKT